ncbi:MAG: HAD hydrolase-like protein [Oscillospiraceae bacterium]|nr:HAD hydrolase-like protein [Oscillospiraceae bacterium]
MSSESASGKATSDKSAGGKSILLFDLDGTIIDSRIGVTRAVQYSLTHFGIEVKDPDLLISFIGPPLRESYKREYGFVGEQAETAVVMFREYYDRRGARECSLYAGIDKLLAGLYRAGRVLLLATSKLEVYALKILEGFGLAAYFTTVVGAQPDGMISHKREVIAKVLSQAGVADLGEAVMIGDSRFDIRGAKAVGLDTVGVLYGFGTREELEESGADIIVESVADLSRLLGV